MGLLGVPAPFKQLINGNTFDFSSIEITIGALSYTNVTEITYSDSLEPGILRGTSAKKKGRTRGEYDAEGSITIYKADLATILAELAALGVGGYMEASFDVTVTMSEGLVSIPVTDSLVGSRITNIEDSHSQGSDALMSTLTLDLMELSRNGLSATSGGPSLAGAGAAIGGLIGGGL
jgi:hypothetical protein